MAQFAWGRSSQGYLVLCWRHTTWLLGVVRLNALSKCFVVPSARIFGCYMCDNVALHKFMLCWSTPLDWLVLWDSTPYPSVLFEHSARIFGCYACNNAALHKLVLCWSTPHHCLVLWDSTPYPSVLPEHSARIFGCCTWDSMAHKLFGVVLETVQHTTRLFDVWLY